LLGDFDVFVFVSHVQFLWELNLNMVKSLEFEGCVNWGRKKGEGRGGGIQKIKGGPLVLSNGAPPFSPSFFFYFFPPFFSLLSVLLEGLVAFVQVMITIARASSSHRKET
jgi:hypothetical protein